MTASSCKIVKTLLCLPLTLTHFGGPTNTDTAKFIEETRVATQHILPPLSCGVSHIPTASKALSSSVPYSAGVRSAFALAT